MHIIDAVYIYGLIFSTAQHVDALDLYLLLKVVVKAAACVRLRLSFK